MCVESTTSPTLCCGHRRCCSVCRSHVAQHSLPAETCQGGGAKSLWIGNQLKTQQAILLTSEFNFAQLFANVSSLPKQRSSSARLRGKCQHQPRALTLRLQSTRRTPQPQSFTCRHALSHQIDLHRTAANESPRLKPCVSALL